MLLGSSQVNIGLRIYLKDEFSGPARQIKNQLENLRGETKLYQDSLRSARNMYGGLFAAGAAVTMGMAQAYQVGAKFDFTMRGVAAAAGATNDQFERMTSMANNLGSKSLFMPQDYAGTMRELALAGLDAKEVMASITPVMHLAGGAMEDLKVSSEIATNAMYMFGYNKSKLGDWEYVSDILAQGAVKSQIALRDLGETIKYAGSTAMDMGQTLSDVTAMAMVLGNAGIKGSMAGTAIENMFRYMALGLGQYAKTGRAQVWEKIGLDPQSLVDIQGNLKPMPEILDALFKATQNFGDVDKQNILYEIFGVRGKRAASKLLSGADDYRKAMNELKNSKGVAGAMYGKLMDSPQGAILQMMGSWKALMNQFAESIAPLVTPILKILASILQFVSAIMKTPMGSWLTMLTVGIILFKTAVWGVKAAIAGAALAMNVINTSFATASTSIKMATIDLLNFRSAAAGMTVGGAPGGAGMGVGLGAAMGMGNVSATVGRTRTGTYYARTAAGSRFISSAEAQAMGLGLAAGTRAPALGAAGAAARTGGLGMGALMGAAGIGIGGYQALTSQDTMGKIGGLGMAAGGVMTFIPGLQLVGAGLMIVSSLLPMLAGSTDNNTAATKANTDSQAELLSSQDRLRLTFMANVDDQGRSGMIRSLFKRTVGENDAVDWQLKQSLETYKQDPNSYRGGKYYDWSNKDRVDVYVHGALDKSVFKAEFNKNLNMAIPVQ